jgi:hypothetical protein
MKGGGQVMLNLVTDQGNDDLQIILDAVRYLVCEHQRIVLRLYALDNFFLQAHIGHLSGLDKFMLSQRAKQQRFIHRHRSRMQGRRLGYLNHHAGRAPARCYRPHHIGRKHRTRLSMFLPLQDHGLSGAVDFVQQSYTF